MSSTDMIAWFVTDKVGETKDYWSTGHSRPVVDTTSNLTEGESPVFDTGTGKMKFVTRRKLDTGDSEQDFLVRLGEQMPMIYGYKKGTSQWTKHDTYGVWSLKIEEDGGVEDAGLDESELLRSDASEEHGLWLWVSWFCVGLLLLVSKRYAKKHWTLVHYLHALMGYFVLVVTIVFSTKMMKWRFG